MKWIPGLKKLKQNLPLSYISVNSTDVKRSSAASSRHMSALKVSHCLPESRQINAPEYRASNEQRVYSKAAPCKSCLNVRCADAGDFRMLNLLQKKEKKKSQMGCR